MWAALGVGIAGVLVGTARPARAVVINATFDSSVTGLSNAGQWESALNSADAEIAGLLSDPITINITFKASAGTSVFGESGYSLQTVGSYSTMVAVLAADAKSADDRTSVASLPAVDPTNGATYWTTTAQAKALGLRSANNAASDGTVTIGTGYTFTYDPAHRAVAGAYDFIGIAEHEITEVMGRAGTYNLGTGRYGPLDLFGYQFGTGGTGTGTLNLAASQANNYFCIDGGKTPLKLNNNAANGEDDKDWGSGTNDSFNAYSSSGVANGISAVDVREMDVIGYDLAAVPEPATLTVMAAAAVGALCRRRKARRRA